jgi:hypothetical protein
VSGGLMSASPGRIGIGIASPEEPLDVRTPAGQPATLRLKSGGSWSADITQSPDSVLSLGNGGQPRLNLLASGNVGIGTTSPGERLHVDGNARLSGHLHKDYLGGPFPVTPLAMGMIGANGTLMWGTPNVTSFWNATQNRYEITIQGVSYLASGNFVVLITTSADSAPAYYSSVSGRLTVHFSGAFGNVQRRFSFIVYGAP